MYATSLVLDEIFYIVWNTRKLDTKCRQRLKAMLVEGINREEQQMVNRILHAIRRGWVDVVA